MGVTPLQMDALITFTLSMYELLGVTILQLHGMYDEVSSSPPISMHSQRIAILTSQELRMANNLCMDEINILRELRSCDTHYCVGDTKGHFTRGVRTMKVRVHIEPTIGLEKVFY
jgi:hypothetical protein